MQRLTAPCAYRIREKASIFITELHPAANADERAAILALVRRRDHDASHHCFAWREGPGGEQGADDAGEPSGTAGPPMLRVLEGAELGQVLAVCSRWFGGTKLGTGGLVRAYTDGVQGALAEARAQGLLEELRVWRQGRLAIAVAQAHLPYTVLAGFPEAQVLGQEAGPGGVVLLHFRMPPGREAALETAWQERSRGGRVDWDPAAPGAVGKPG